jgi:hypothetical protein
LPGSVEVTTYMIVPSGLSSWSVIWIPALGTFESSLRLHQPARGA